MNFYSTLSVLGVGAIAAAGLAIGQGAASCKSTTVNTTQPAAACAQTASTVHAVSHGVQAHAHGVVQAGPTAPTPATPPADVTSERAARLEELLWRQRHEAPPEPAAIAELPEPPMEPAPPAVAGPQDDPAPKLRRAFRYKDGELEPLDAEAAEEARTELQRAHEELQRAHEVDMEQVHREIERAMQEVERVRTTELERAQREIERAMREVERVQSQVAEKVERETARAMRGAEQAMREAEVYARSAPPVTALKTYAGARAGQAKVRATAPRAQGAGRAGTNRERELEARVAELESELARVRSGRTAPVGDADCTPERGRVLVAPRVRGTVALPRMQGLQGLEGLRALGDLAPKLEKLKGKMHVLGEGVDGHCVIEIDGNKVRVHNSSGGDCCAEGEDGDESVEMEWGDADSWEEDFDDEDEDEDEDEADDEEDEDDGDEDEDEDDDSDRTVYYSTPSPGVAGGVYSFGPATTMPHSGYSFDTASLLPGTYGLVTTTPNAFGTTVDVPALTPAPATEDRLRSLIEDMRSEVDSLRSALQGLRTEVERRKANELR